MRPIQGCRLFRGHPSVGGGSGLENLLTLPGMATRPENLLTFRSPPNRICNQGCTRNRWAALDANKRKGSWRPGGVFLNQNIKEMHGFIRVCNLTKLCMHSFPLLLSRNGSSRLARRDAAESVGGCPRNFACFPGEYSKEPTKKSRGIRSSSREHAETFLVIPVLGVCWTAHGQRLFLVIPQRPETLYVIPHAQRGAASRVCPAGGTCPTNVPRRPPAPRGRKTLRAPRGDLFLAIPRQTY